MFLADCHMHSTCSSDGIDSLSDMAAAARDRGMDAICFTEHCDLDHYLTGEFDPSHLRSWEEFSRQIPDVIKNAPEGLEIRKGIELGATHHYPELGAKIASMPELDFIIGTLHNLRDTKDFYCLEYKSQEQCYALLDKYLDEHIEMAELGLFDVVAHIGYTTRYMSSAGFDANITIERHGERLEKLFKTLIHNGKGIEMNLSGFRHKAIMGPIPTAQIISFYRELGGEIITLGADAHMTAHAGLYVPEGQALLKELGFKYAAIFRRRNGEFYKI